MNQRPHLESRSSENPFEIEQWDRTQELLYCSAAGTVLTVGDINCGGVKEGPLAPEREAARWDATLPPIA